MHFNNIFVYSDDLAPQFILPFLQRQVIIRFQSGRSAAW